MLCNIQGNTVIKVKHYLSLFIGLVLYFAISLPVFAIDENIAVDNSEQTQSIVDILEFIEPDKDKYGMSSVDFTNLYVGEPMEVYNYTTEGFVPIDLFLPILYDGKLAAVLSDLRGSGIFSIQNTLVEPIASNVNINDEFALVFDKQNCYLFDGSNWILLKTYSYPNDNNAILDTNNARNVSVIEMNTLGNATPLEYNSVVTRGYNSAFAAGITLEIDGQDITGDVEPILKNNRTLVPLRAVAEYLGATVDYKDRTVTVISENKIITLPLDAREAVLQSTDGTSITQQTIDLDVAAHIYKERTMVPLRFVAEAMGIQVDYLASEKKVQVVSLDPLLVDGIQLKYATTYSRVGMHRELNLYSNYADTAKLYGALQDGIIREVSEPETSYGNLFEISDYYIEQYIVGFYDEAPIYEKYSGENAVNADLTFVLYEMLEGEPEFGSDSQQLLYNQQTGKWYAFSADAYKMVVELLQTAQSKSLYSWSA